MPAISPDELQRLIGEAVTAAIERVTCFFNEKLAKVNRRLEEQDLELNITKERLKKIEVAVNHQEQYSRRTHIRIKGLEVRSGQTCKEEVVKFINNNLSLKEAPLRLCQLLTSTPPTLYPSVNLTARLL
jgi:hypothetical protein